MVSKLHSLPYVSFDVFFGSLLAHTSPRQRPSDCDTDEKESANQSEKKARVSVSAILAGNELTPLNSRRH